MRWVLQKKQLCDIYLINCPKETLPEKQWRAELSQVKNIFPQIKAFGETKREALKNLRKNINGFRQLLTPRKIFIGLTEKIKFDDYDTGYIFNDFFLRHEEKYPAWIIGFNNHNQTSLFR